MLIKNMQYTCSMHAFNLNEFLTKCVLYIMRANIDKIFWIAQNILNCCVLLMTVHFGKG